jgi:capsular polysaccharide biosynthesis protein
LVAGVKPVILLVKLPVPLLSLVFEPVISGFVAAPQQTPRAVTSAPPSSVILPPVDTEVVVILLIAVVVSVGISVFLQLVNVAIPARKQIKTKRFKTFFIIN